MRDYKIIVKEAELLAGSTEAIVIYLKERADRIIATKSWVEGDEKLEQTLLGLKHPLVDLSLARYCGFTETAKVLFNRDQRQALRLAVLANQVLASNYHQFFFSPICLFNNGNKNQFKTYLISASYEELYALFENPKLDADFLEEFLKGDEIWEAMSEDKRQFIVLTLTQNERMGIPFDKKIIGDTGFKYEAVFEAAWKLAETVPVTDKWAYVLGSLYGRLVTSSSIKQPLKSVNRWYPTSSDSIEKEKKHNSEGFTSDYQSVRIGLTKLALTNAKADVGNFLESEDIALRLAAYNYADLTPVQIAQACLKDGGIGFQKLLHNKHIWSSKTKRCALSDGAWTVNIFALGTYSEFEDRYSKEYPEWFCNKEDSTSKPSDELVTKADLEESASRLLNPDAIAPEQSCSDLVAENIYKAVRDRFAKEYPAWFKDGRCFIPQSFDELVTKTDLKQLTSGLFNQKKAFEELMSKVDAIGSRLSFIWWFSLGALVGAFFSIL